MKNDVPPCVWKNKEELMEWVGSSDCENGVKQTADFLSQILNLDKLQRDTHSRMVHALDDSSKKYEFSNSERNALALLLQEHNRKKFLGHTFTRRGPTVDIARELEEGRELKYHPSNFSPGEIAFSLHTANGEMLPGHHFGFPGAKTKGAIVFRDSFYDEICSNEIPDNEWEEFNSWLTKNEWHSWSRLHHHTNMDAKECIRLLSDHVRSVDGKTLEQLFTDDDTTQNADTLWGIIKCLLSIDALRSKIQRPGGSYGVGIRAARLDAQRNLHTLPIRASDVKFFISRDMKQHCSIHRFD